MPTTPCSVHSNGRAASVPSLCLRKMIRSGCGGIGYSTVSMAWAERRWPMTSEPSPLPQGNEATMSLKEDLAEFRSGWFRRVPVERQAIMARHIAELRNGLAKTSFKAGDRAPPIMLSNARGETVDVGVLLQN